MSAHVPSLPADIAAGAAEIAGTLFTRAGERGRQESVPYAGLVTPAEAHRLHADGAAVIVDVRTQPEWEFVGHFPGALHIEWRRYGEATPDPAFVAKLAAAVPRSKPVLFLCRSAVRSHHAAEAAARAGFDAAYNILEGFEGELGPEGQRGRTGWRAAGLPWRQG